MIIGLSPATRARDGDGVTSLRLRVETADVPTSAAMVIRAATRLTSGARRQPLAMDDKTRALLKQIQSTRASVVIKPEDVAELIREGYVEESGGGQIYLTEKGGEALKGGG